MRLDGKVAIVTGAGRGLGACLAKALAGEGARVTLFGRTTADLGKVRREIEQYGGMAIDVTGNVSNAADASRLAKDTVAAFGRIDILVNNAGAWVEKGLTDLREEEWDLVLDTNLKGAFLCSQAVVPHMKAAGGGRIIHISSIHGMHPEPGNPSQNASKYGLIGLTESMAEAFRPLNITVNAVCPGALVESLPPNAPPLQSRVPYSQVAALVLFLASEDARFLTGAGILLAGGTGRRIVQPRV